VSLDRITGLRIRTSLLGSGSSLEFVDQVPVRFETRPNDDGTIDEVLVYAGDRCLLHLEQLGKDHYWFAWYGDGPDAERHFNIARRKKRVEITER